jgi:hypothetical protein
MKTALTKIAAGIASLTLVGIGVAAVVAPAAGADPASPGAGSGVTLAQVGDDLLLAGQSNGGDAALVWYQTVGSSTWSVSEPTQTGTVYSAVSMAQLVDNWTIFGLPRQTDLVGMAAEGWNNTLNFWWEPIGSIGSGYWNQEVVGGPGTTYSAPAITTIGNDVVIAAEGPNQTLNFWWQQIGATGWSSLLGQLPGEVTTPPTIAALSNGTLGIAFSDASPWDCTAYVEQLPSKFGQPWQISYPEAACTDANTSSSPTITGPGLYGTDLITTQGGDNSLDSWADDNPYYGPLFYPASYGAEAGTVFSGVSVAQFNNGVAAAAEGVDETFQFYWRNSNSNQWIHESPSYIGSDISQPSLVNVYNYATGTTLVVVATEGPYGNADVYWQLLGSSTWNTIPFPATFSACVNGVCD